MLLVSKPLSGYNQNCPLNLLTEEKLREYPAGRTRSGPIIRGVNAV
jgi:hypothetical protein